MNYEIDRDGFTIVSRVLASEGQDRLLSSLGPIPNAGRRKILAVPGVPTLAHSARLLELVRPHLESEPLPVRAIYFDKSPDKNWMVPWHQDLTLAVREKIAVAGFGPWSTKEGIPHVQPPVVFLQQMLTVRLHLDDADESSGALRVLPRTHRFGILSADRIQALRAETQEHICAVSAGDAMLMRPLLLHASRRSTSTRHRRVLHIEYAAFELPSGLQWCEAG